MKLTRMNKKVQADQYFVYALKELQIQMKYLDNDDLKEFFLCEVDKNNRTRMREVLTALDDDWGSEIIADPILV